MYACVCVYNEDLSAWWKVDPWVKIRMRKIDCAKISIVIWAYPRAKWLSDSIHCTTINYKGMQYFFISYKDLSTYAILTILKKIIYVIHNWTTITNL